MKTRVKPDEATRHPARAELLAYIQQRPGCSIKSAQLALGCPRGTARHHAHILEATGFIERFNQNGRTFLQPTTHSAKECVTAAAKRHPRAALVLTPLERGPVPRVALVPRIASQAGVTRQSVYRWIEQLLKAGVIEAEGHGFSTTLRIAR